MINGSPLGYFSNSRGLRQGDPISPYLFVLVMEFWSIQMDMAIASGELQPLKRGMSIPVFHLLFADDMLLFFKASKKSFSTINGLLAKLALNTGLSINRDKSKLFLSKGCRDKEDPSELIQIPAGNFPVTYLGLPLSHNYLKAKDCNR